MERVQGAMMALYSAFFISAGIPMIRKKRSWIDTWYASSEEQRSLIRDRQFVKLVRFAYKRVPFYASLYSREGVEIDDIQGVADIVKLPYADKGHLKLTPPEQLRPPFPRSKFLVESSTSGSSGVPLVMYRSLGALTLYGAQLMDYMELWGLPGGRKVFFILYNADPSTSLSLPYTSPFSIFNKSHSINPEDGIETIWEKIRMEYPEVIIAHPSMVEDIADFMASNGLVHDTEITFATGGEMLTTRLRKKVAQAFPQSRMLDIYNSVETGLTAFEMPGRSGMYINDYAVILEDGKKHVASNGTSYVEPVYTNLWNFGTPLIRYRGIEDLLRIEETDWENGPGERRITEILGRASEMIVSPSGRRYSVCIVMSAHADLLGVKRFQYVQSDPANLTFRYVAEDGANIEEIEREAERQTRTLFGDDLTFRCQVVSSLEKRTKSLKIPLLVRD